MTKYILHPTVKNLDTNPRTYWGTTPYPKGAECLGVVKQVNGFTFDGKALFRLPNSNLVTGTCGGIKPINPKMIINLED